MKNQVMHALSALNVSFRCPNWHGTSWFIQKKNLGNVQGVRIAFLKSLLSLSTPREMLVGMLRIKVGQRE